MTGLLARSLVASSHCPRCGQVVYLGACYEDPFTQDLRADGDIPESVIAEMRGWVCEHQGADGLHRWTTDGPIEFRPVTAIHVEVLSAKEHQ